MGLQVRAIAFKKAWDRDPRETYSKLAEDIGCHFSMISTWSRGGGISSRFAGKLAEELNVDPNVLYTYAPKGGRSDLSMTPRQFLNRRKPGSGESSANGGGKVVNMKKHPRSLARNAGKRLVRAVEDAILRKQDIESISAHLQHAREDVVLAMASKRFLQDDPLLKLYDAIGQAEQILDNEVKGK